MYAIAREMEAGLKVGDLVGKRVVIFDVEIKNTISKETGIGWKDFDKMSVSTACAFDYQDMRFRVFMDDNYE